jgi:hypothetical protein
MLDLLQFCLFSVQSRHKPVLLVRDRDERMLGLKVPAGGVSHVGWVLLAATWRGLRVALKTRLLPANISAVQGYHGEL